MSVGPSTGAAGTAASARAGPCANSANTRVANPGEGHGIVLNPDKAQTVSLGALDKVIVLADS